MAVDANVLIFERIKEENTKNKKIYETIKKGFDRAFSTILDANITTLIASLIIVCLWIWDQLKVFQLLYL